VAVEVAAAAAVAVVAAVAAAAVTAVAVTAVAVALKQQRLTQQGEGASANNDDDNITTCEEEEEEEEEGGALVVNTCDQAGAARGVRRRGDLGGAQERGARPALLLHGLRDLDSGQRQAWREPHPGHLLIGALLSPHGLDMVYRYSYYRITSLLSMRSIMV